MELDNVKERTYDRERSKLEKRKLSRLKVVRAYRKQHPNRSRAYDLIARLIRAGKLVRPSNCAECGDAARIYAHHPDYRKPKSVVWVCQPCHKMQHKKAA